MRVEDWFDNFCSRLIVWIERGDWPVIGTDGWLAWKTAFVRHGVEETIAEQAAWRLAENPPAFADKILPAFLTHVRDLWAQQGSSDGQTTDREAAANLSRDCDDCGGSTGITIRWRKLSAGVVVDGRAIEPTIRLFCRCPMGRWVERTLKANSPEVHKRISNLDDYPFLWGFEYRAPEIDARPGESFAEYWTRIRPTDAELKTPWVGSLARANRQATPVPATTTKRTQVFLNGHEDNTPF